MSRMCGGLAGLCLASCTTGPPRGSQQAEAGSEDATSTSSSTRHAETSGDDTDSPASTGAPDPGPGPGVTQLDPPPPPVAGGTLIVTNDQRYVVAADADRDTIHIFDVEAEQEVHVVPLPQGSEPGRVVQTRSGHAAVVLRRGGRVVELRLEDGAIVREPPACLNPRGLGYDPGTGDLWVTCVQETLVRLGDNGTREVFELGFEARDVVATAPVAVSTFKQASVRYLDAQANVQFETPAQVLTTPMGNLATPTTTIRTLRADSGWIMLHRVSSEDPIPITPSGSYYGPGPCGLPSTLALSRYAIAKGGVTTRTLALGYVIDLAVHPGLNEAAVVTRDDEGIGHYARLQLYDDANATCITVPLPQTYGEPVALDYAGDGTLWIQSREPAELYRVQPGGNFAAFELLGPSVFDTGHDLFHRPTSGGLACASCHPEGREDGFTFLFDGLPSVGTRRRTQALNVDLQGTAPFHWGGDLKDMHELIEVVRGERMGGPFLFDDEKDALTRYVYALPREAPMRAADDPAVVAGAAAFEVAGCRECHRGPRLTNAQTVNLEPYGAIQVPTLIGVAYRGPYMHDGRSATLRDAVVDMLRFSTPTGPVDGASIDAIVAYLEAQ